MKHDFGKLCSALLSCFDSGKLRSARQTQLSGLSSVCGATVMFHKRRQTQLSGAGRAAASAHAVWRRHGLLVLGEGPEAAPHATRSRGKSRTRCAVCRARAGKRRRAMEIGLLTCARKGRWGHGAAHGWGALESPMPRLLPPDLGKGGGQGRSFRPGQGAARAVHQGAGIIASVNRYPHTILSTPGTSGYHLAYKLVHNKPTDRVSFNRGRDQQP